MRAVGRLAGRGARGPRRGIVSRGETGIGKTALLGHLAENAEGCTVVRAADAEFESELSLTSLSELIGALVDVLRELPDRYADVLMTLLPQKADDSAGLSMAAGGRHAICAATLASLTASAARRAPLCLIDDAHLIDDASASALLFTACQLRADAALIVFAIRDVPDFGQAGPQAPRDAADLVQAAAGGLLRETEFFAEVRRQPGRLRASAGAVRR